MPEWPWFLILIYSWYLLCMSVKFTESILSACYHTLHKSRRKGLRSREHYVWLSHSQLERMSPPLMHSRGKTYSCLCVHVASCSWQWRFLHQEQTDRHFWDSQVTFTRLSSQYAHVRLGCPFVPARAVLVDFHPPMDTTTCLNIQEALSSTLTLLHHVAGPCRLPCFSLIVLGNYPEVMNMLLSELYM